MKKVVPYKFKWQCENIPTSKKVIREIFQIKEKKKKRKLGSKKYKKSEQEEKEKEEEKKNEQRIKKITKTFYGVLADRLDTTMYAKSKVNQMFTNLKAYTA